MVLSSPEILDRAFKYFVDNHINKDFKSQQFKDIATNIFDKYWYNISSLPASSTGKFHHPIENLKPFGLINHTLRVKYIVMRLIMEEGIVDLSDEIILAAYCHDFGKYMVWIKACSYPLHGQESVNMIEEYISELRQVKLISRMITNHMHHWCDCKMEDEYDRIVAYADFIATDPSVDIKIDYFTEDMFKEDIFKRW